ncbi:MAG TPA: VWA domain-containing protein [Vicinamibacterales bacterium]|nr:VWA domain-containing protein [Vicinamibacterales bacterium]
MRLVTLALCAVLLQAPTPAQPTFKSATELVEVDAVVFDKSGNFVPGLKAGDITIYENGKPQKIQQFFMVTHDLGLAEGSVASEYADKADYGAHRVFVMLFDEGHLANESLMRVKSGSEQFVREMFTAGDAGGVFLNGGMYKGRLTIDKGELLSGIRAVQPAFENRQGILAPFREWPRINSEVEASRIADGAREVTDALGVKACQEDPQACQSEGGLGNVENLIQQKARLYVRQARMLTSRTMQSLETVAKGLAKIPGRKTVVLMTEGFFVEDSRGALQTIAAQAARSGITIYSIDGRGLINGLGNNPDVTRMERARTTSFDTGDDGPNILTEGTGGFMVRNIDEIKRGFGLIVRDTSTYYVIGYQPENATMDGKVRKIEVKASVPGVKVRARKSYAATKLPPQEAIWGFSR